MPRLSPSLDQKDRTHLRLIATMCRPTGTTASRLETSLAQTLAQPPQTPSYAASSTAPTKTYTAFFSISTVASCSKNTSMDTTFSVHINSAQPPSPSSAL